MVRSEDLVSDDAVGEFGDESLRTENVVQPPTNVLRWKNTVYIYDETDDPTSAVHHVGPECVSILFLRVEMPGD